MDVEGVDARPGLVAAGRRDVGDTGVEGEGGGVVDEGEDFAVWWGGWVVVVGGVWLCLVLVVGEVYTLGDGFGAGGGEEAFVNWRESGVQQFIEAGEAEGGGTLLEEESKHEWTVDVDEDP